MSHEITDVPPDDPVEAAIFKLSEKRRLSKALLPPARKFRRITNHLLEAREVGRVVLIQRTSLALIRFLSQFYRIDCPRILVLGARPIRIIGFSINELFGDYNMGQKRIRIWMRTTKRHQVTSGRTLLVTLLHEFCHHLECESLLYQVKELQRAKLQLTPHTRGFYARLDQLYHHALDVPVGKRKPLRWQLIEGGRYMRIWTSTARGSQKKGQGTFSG